MYKQSQKFQRYPVIHLMLFYFRKVFFICVCVCLTLSKFQNLMKQNLQFTLECIFIKYTDVQIYFYVHKYNDIP